MIRRSSAATPIQHRALLLHPLGMILDLARDARHDLIRLFARGMIEAFRDPRIIKAEIARQGGRRSAQIVWRDGPHSAFLTPLRSPVIAWPHG